jgi:hypothetical protein
MKTAFSRLVVSLLALLTVVVALATSILKLVVTAVGLLTNAVERLGTKNVTSLKSEVTEAPRANLRVLPTPSTKRDELTRALTGLKFQTPAVKRFVASLTENDMKQDIRDLIKAGLKDLAA